MRFSVLGRHGRGEDAGEEGEEEGEGGLELHFGGGGGGGGEEMEAVMRWW